MPAGGEDTAAEDRDWDLDPQTKVGRWHLDRGNPEEQMSQGCSQGTAMLSGVPCAAVVFSRERGKRNQPSGAQCWTRALPQTQGLLAMNFSCATQVKQGHVLTQGGGRENRCVEGLHAVGFCHHQYCYPHSPKDRAEVFCARKSLSVQGAHRSHDKEP